MLRMLMPSQKTSFYPSNSSFVNSLYFCILTAKNFRYLFLNLSLKIRTMLKNSVFILFLLICTYSFSQSGGFTINGKVSGVPDGAEVKLLEGEKEVGKTKIYKGLFIVKGEVNEPVLVKLNIGAIKIVDIYLENKVIALHEIPDETFSGEIMGSTEETAKNYLFRATQKLRAQLGKV